MPIYSAMTVTVRREADAGIGTCDAMPDWETRPDASLGEFLAGQHTLAAAFEERAARVRALIDAATPRDPHRRAVCAHIVDRLYDPDRAAKETR